MKNWIKTVGMMVILVILDQIVKILSISHLKDQNPVELIAGVLELRYIENRGAAFGILQNKQGFFLVITCIVILGILWILPRMSKNRRFLYMQFCLTFLAAGAIGNMIDRVGRKYVVDMIYFKLIDFPVFNVADIYVTVSMFFIIILILFYYKEEELNEIFALKTKSK